MEGEPDDTLPLENNADVPIIEVTPTPIEEVNELQHIVEVQNQNNDNEVEEDRTNLSNSRSGQLIEINSNESANNLPVDNDIQPENVVEDMVNESSEVSPEISTEVSNDCDSFTEQPNSEPNFLDPLQSDSSMRRRSEERENSIPSYSGKRRSIDNVNTTIHTLSVSKGTSTPTKNFPIARSRKSSKSVGKTTSDSFLFYDPKFHIETEISEVRKHYDSEILLLNAKLGIFYFLFL
jgi:hypothetical protein